jgi:hypothetical protein
MLITTVLLCTNLSMSHRSVCVLPLMHPLLLLLLLLLPLLWPQVALARRASRLDVPHQC